MTCYLGGYRDNYSHDLEMVANLYYGDGTGLACGFGDIGSVCRCDVTYRHSDDVVRGNGLAMGGASVAWGERRFWTDPDMPDLREGQRGG